MPTWLPDDFTLPVETCNLPFGNPNLLVGAPREYRSGVHNGLDFNCGTSDHVINAAGAGQVLFVVNDYVDATVEDRDAVLLQAETAIDTPFWSLAMLYGNFVIVDHRLSSGERAVTIYAHLSEVAEGIVPGVQVDSTTPLGLVGQHWHVGSGGWHHQQPRFGAPCTGSYTSTISRSAISKARRRPSRCTCRSSASLTARWWAAASGCG